MSESATHEGAGVIERRAFLAMTLATTAMVDVATSAESPPSTAPTMSSTLSLFPGFESIRIETSGATINGVKGGNGPPLLLLHGWPQTHAEWHRVAPRLAEHFTVVATDLRGYGDSSKPEDGTNHSGYGKREMARDQVQVMESLGFRRFAVVGHDRGGRVAHRMALDHVDRVSRLAVLDIVPTAKIFATVNKALATAYYHWFFLIQAAPLPETLIGSNAEFFLRGIFRAQMPHNISDEAFGHYLRAAKIPGTIHAMCEDYRAAASIDLEHDEADKGKKVACPMLVIWGLRGAMNNLYDVTATWRERASDVHGKGLQCGHWVPEEVPDELLADLNTFLKA